MFDTMTLTKTMGALCGSLLVFMFGAWGAESLYSTHPEAHGEGEIIQAYSIDTGAAEAEGDAPVEEVPVFAELLAVADVAAGEKVFGKCAACHKVDGTDGIGPHLNGVVDRAKASIGGYEYSEVLVGMAADAWTADNLNGFLENPKGYAPGTKMAFAGLSKPQERANVIAWLATTQ